MASSTTISTYKVWTYLTAKGSVRTNRFACSVTVHKSGSWICWSKCYGKWTIPCMDFTLGTMRISCFPCHHMTCCITSACFTASIDRIAACLYGADIFIFFCSHDSIRMTCNVVPYSVFNNYNCLFDWLFLRGVLIITGMYQCIQHAWTMNLELGMCCLQILLIPWEWWILSGRRATGTQSGFGSTLCRMQLLIV